MKLRGPHWWLAAALYVAICLLVVLPEVSDFFSPFPIHLSDLLRHNR